jgi:hypothetical protein
VAAKLSKSEAARLKGAAMAKHDDQSTLMAVEPIKRSSRSGKPPKASRKPAPRGEPKSTKRRTPEATPKPEASGPAPAPPPLAKPPKPKMRLVNGKLIPADDGPRLF